MNNSSCILLGDIHLGRSQSLGKTAIGSALNSRIIDQLNLLNWVHDQAVSRSIKHIILTGDIFDEPRPSYQLVELFIDWLKKCGDNDIDVHIIVGNHDILRSGQFITSPLDIINSVDFENVLVYKKISTLHLDGMSITMVPFRDRRSFNTQSNAEAINVIKNQITYQLPSIDKFASKVLIGHLALEGSIPVGNELDDLANELFCHLDMFKGYDYVFMGHIHKFQIMREVPNYIAHIGSMDISDFGETDQDKFIAIFDANKNLEYVKIPTRKLININIDLPDETTNATEFVQNYINHIDALNNAIVKVNIKLPSNGSYTIDRSIIEKQLNNNGVFFTSKISEERSFVSIKKQINKTIDNAINEISAIKTYSSLIEENIREEFIKIACDTVNEFKENIK